MRKTSDPLFPKWMNVDCTLLTGCFLFNNHRCKPSASAHSNVCRKPKFHSQARMGRNVCEIGVRASLTENRAESAWGLGETGRQFTEVTPRRMSLLGYEAGKRLI